MNENEIDDYDRVIELIQNDGDVEEIKAIIKSGFGLRPEIVDDKKRALIGLLYYFKEYSLLLEKLNKHE